LRLRKNVANGTHESDQGSQKLVPNAQLVGSVQWGKRTQNGEEGTFHDMQTTREQPLQDIRDALATLIQQQKPISRQSIMLQARVSYGVLDGCLQRHPDLLYQIDQAALAYALAHPQKDPLHALQQELRQLISTLENSSLTGDELRLLLLSELYRLVPPSGTSA
jgi:hypothetical protein